MPDIRPNKRFPRTNSPLVNVVAGGIGLGMVCIGIWGMSDGLTTWRLPFWKMEFPYGLIVGAFLLVWYSIPLSIGRNFLPGLETIHITQEEIRCQLGPIVLWRLSFTDIHTVIRTGSPVSKGPAPPPYVLRTKKKFRHIIFSTRAAEELREECRDWKAKRRARNSQFRMGHRKLTSDQQVKRWFERRLLLTRFRMEWTEEAEEILRQRLTTTTFIL